MAKAKKQAASDPKKTKKLTLLEVKSIVAGQKADSLSASGASKLSSDRATALDYYNGVMSDMPHTEGRSRAISTDVSDVVDGLMPNLMDIFCGSDEVVRFEPVGPEDVAASEQESKYIGHVFMQKNPGYNILHDMFKDGLLCKTGLVKVWWETKEDAEEETYFDQETDTLAVLIARPDMEVTAYGQNEDGTHNVTLTKRASYGCAKVVNVPPEEFGIARRTRKMQDTPYCFHEPGGGVPEDDLIAQGYDPEQIKKLATWAEGKSRGKEAQARDTVGENATQGGGAVETRGQRPVQITEHYVIMDYEGDGKACRYQVMTGGDEGVVLTKHGKPAIEKHSHVPFAAVHPDPMPHRFFGRSIADKVIDTQRVKTALTRGVLDNIYLINNQQIEVSESHATDSTIDDLLNKRIGGIVRTKQPGGLVPVVVQPIADKLFPALEYFDREREWRTGVTREGQGLDAEALQNQSATAARQLHSAAQAKMKLIARNFAAGVEDLFWLLHYVVRKNASKPDTVRMTNSWEVVDPRQWRARDDMTVTVGLGSGGKQEQLAGLQLLIAAQKEASMAPIGMVKPKHFYNAAKDLVKLLDKRDVSLYFDDPGDGPMPDPPPPPELQKAQMESQNKQQEMQMKAGIETLQAKADIATNNTKVQADLALNREKAQLEMQMKREEHALKMTEMRMKLVGVAANAAVKAAPQPTVGEDGETQGPPPQPDMAVFEQMMAHINMNTPQHGANGAAPPAGPTRKRARRLGPGDWEIEG